MIDTFNAQLLVKPLISHSFNCVHYICMFSCLCRINALEQYSTSFLFTLMIIIIIMVIFRCYFSGEHIALSIKKKQTNNNNNNGVNIELGKNNRLKVLCMMQINTFYMNFTIT